MTNMIKEDICFGLLLLLLAAGASALNLNCSVSYAGGMIEFRLFPKPDPHCVPHWSTAEGKPIAIGDDIDKALVEASSHDEIILKKCIPKLKCSVDCERSDGNAQNFEANCSADCFVSEPTSATQNKALPLSACIPLVCLVVVILSLDILYD